jgi:hypothetical protein
MGPAHQQRIRSGPATYECLYLDAGLQKVADSPKLEGGVTTSKTRRDDHAIVVARSLLFTNVLLPIALKGLKGLGELELGNNEGLIVLDSLRIRNGYAEGALAPRLPRANSVVKCWVNRQILVASYDVYSRFSRSVMSATLLTGDDYNASKVTSMYRRSDSTRDRTEF